MAMAGLPQCRPMCMSPGLHFGPLCPDFCVTYPDKCDGTEHTPGSTPSRSTARPPAISSLFRLSPATKRVPFGQSFPGRTLNDVAT